MSSRSDYPALVVKAEKAVEGVKDPELKRVAYKKVLDDMLAAGSSGTSHGGRTAVAKRAVSKVGEREGAVKKGGPQFYVEELATDGFFKKPKSIAQVKMELENGGHHIPVTSLSGPVQILCQRKVLRRQRITDEPYPVSQRAVYVSAIVSAC